MQQIKVKHVSGLCCSFIIQVLYSVVYLPPVTLPTGFLFEWNSNKTSFNFVMSTSPLFSITHTPPPPPPVSSFIIITGRDVKQCFIKSERKVVIAPYNMSLWSYVLTHSNHIQDLPWCQHLHNIMFSISRQHVSTNGNLFMNGAWKILRLQVCLAVVLVSVGVLVRQQVETWHYLRHFYIYF